MADIKNITYLNKTFSDFKVSLNDYAKTYFPSTYNDFSEASVGTMFIEMASYVGDVLSFYLDTQFQENLLLYTKERENILASAYALGYRPKVTYASTTEVDIYQLLPAINVSGSSVPDFSYGLLIPINTPISATINAQKFLTHEQIDFSDETAEISFYDSNNFLARKSVIVSSGEIKSTTFTFTSPIKFNSVVLEDQNIIQILSATSIDLGDYFEVPYLANETVETKTYNGTPEVPYLLSYTKVPNRFVTRFQSDGSLKISFGAGTSNKTDEQILPNPNNINLGFVESVSELESNYNKAAIFYAKEYGVVPSNGTLTITYVVGGGIDSNVPSNSIIKLSINLNYTNFPEGKLVGDPLLPAILASVLVTNINPAVGGRDGDSIDEIRLNTLASFQAQNRAVTKEDYAIRAMSMPADYGSIAKAYVKNGEGLILELSVLSYNINKNLVLSNSSLLLNLRQYLYKYRMATDVINISQAFIINIGVNFDITISPGFSNKQIMLLCIQKLQDFFAIDNWQINQPIQLSEIHSILLRIKGVQTVLKIEIYNKNSFGYSEYGYDILGATRNNIIYPSIDPAIFEVKYPSQDIKGRVIAI